MIWKLVVVSGISNRKQILPPKKKENTKKKKKTYLEENLHTFFNEIKQGLQTIFLHFNCLGM